MATHFIRKEIWSLGNDDPIIINYAKAVEVMQRRNDEDPTSWTYQAGMHGTNYKPDPPLDKPMRELANQCQHASWYFTPWHRMYLYYFERIVRAAAVEAWKTEPAKKDDKVAIAAEKDAGQWALPYWDYSINGALPVPFRWVGQPALYELLRDPKINAGWALHPEVTSAKNALEQSQFFVEKGLLSFGGGVGGPAFYAEPFGRLEGQPHNTVHSAVGGPGTAQTVYGPIIIDGTKGGLMGDLRTAALDPIFWLHHANIDRLWAVWNHMSTTHTNPDDKRWTSQTFAFWDENRSVVAKACGDVVDTTKLDYTYDNLAPPASTSKATKKPHQEVAMTASGTAPQSAMVGASVGAMHLVGEAASVTVAIDGRAAAAFLAANPDPRVILKIENIEGDEDPGVVYGISVNLPGEEPQHVGAISFFGIEETTDPSGDNHPHSLRFAHDITDAVGDLAAGGGGGNLVVTLEPLGLIPPVGVEDTGQTATAGHRISIGSVSVFFA